MIVLRNSRRVGCKRFDRTRVADIETPPPHEARRPTSETTRARNNHRLFRRSRCSRPAVVSCARASRERVTPPPLTAGERSASFRSSDRSTPRRDRVARRSDVYVTRTRRHDDVRRDERPRRFSAARGAAWSGEKQNEKRRRFVHVMILSREDEAAPLGPIASRPSTGYGRTSGRRSRGPRRQTRRDGKRLSTTTSKR